MAMINVYMKAHLLQLDASSFKSLLVWGDKKTENRKDDDDDDCCLGDKKTEIRSIVVMIGGDSVFLVMWISKLVLRLMERMIMMSN